MEENISKTLIKSLLDSYEISVRASNTCELLNIRTIEALHEYISKYRGFLGVSNCGRKTNQELLELHKKYLPALRALGYKYDEELKSELLKPNETNEKKVQERDLDILSLFNNRVSLSQIAEVFDLTRSQVGHILRGLGKRPRETAANERILRLFAIFKKIKEEVNNSTSSEEIYIKYGKESIAQINKQFNTSISKMIRTQEQKDIAKMFKSGVKPKEIAKKLGITRDYVYTLKNSKGLRTLPPAGTVSARNKKILKDVKSGLKYKDIGKKYHVTDRLVATIVNLHKKESQKKGRV